MHGLTVEPGAPSHDRNLDPPSNTPPGGPTSYTSDISSLTPSQSISQQAGTSVEAEPIREPSDSPTGARKPEEEIFYQGHVTISLPPAHAVSDLELPTGVRTPPPTFPTPPSTSTPAPTPSHPVANGNDTDFKQSPGTGPRRTRSRHRRPPSRRISEVSNEDAEEHNADAPSRSRLPPTSPRTNSSTIVANGVASRRSESSDDALQGPLEVVENNPFRTKTIANGVHDEIPSPGSKKNKLRERKTSSTFLGSLRGLFHLRGRAKGMDGPSAVWEGPLVAEPHGSRGTNGWVTRIDGHLRTRQDSSDSERGGGNRRESGVKSKLRKGPTKPGGKSASARSTPTRASTSGWLTDGGSGPGTARGQGKRRKKSIAALKGPEAGFTDGEVEHEVERGERRQSIDVYPSSHRNTLSPVVQRDKSSQARSQMTPSPYLTKGISSSSTGDTASVGAKRNRRVTTDLSNVGSSENTLDIGIQTPRPRRSSIILPGPSDTSPQTPQQVQAGSSSGSQKGRRNAKPGILHTPNGSADQSLMSIVEDVARQNRERRLAPSQTISKEHAYLTGGELPTLELPRAPSLQVPQPGYSTHDSRFGRLPNGSSRSLDLPPGRSTTLPSLPVSLATTSNVRDGSWSDSATKPASRPAKSPFPSALRNPSRTPSPSPVPATISSGTARETGMNTQAVTAIAEPVQPRGRSMERATNRMSVSSDPRDSMSISSYETGRESPMNSPPSSPLARPLSLLAQSPSQTPAARPPPMSREQVSRDHDHGGTSSTASADTQTVRRKSVRVSLQPTFSPTPPAVYDQFDDDDEPGGRRTSWSSRSAEVHKTNRVAGAAPNDMWQDSSEEDEEYSRARKLLSQMGKGKEKA